MTDNRNTILAVILSGLVLIGWQYFFNMPQMEKQRAQQALLRVGLGGMAERGAKTLYSDEKFVESIRRQIAENKRPISRRQQDALARLLEF